jgi:hypothetical protein
MANTPKIAPFDGTTRTRWIPQIEDALRANYQRLIEELNLIGRARAEALENHPPENAKVLDAPQREALGAVESGANMQRQFAVSCIDKGRGLISARELETFEPAAASTAFDVKLDRMELERSHELVPLSKAATVAQLQLNKFKRDHGLEREARFAESWKDPMTIILLCLAGEAIVNAGTFSAAGGGILGGLFAALLASGVNFGAGLVTGAVGLRRLTHAFGRQRAWGWGWTIVGVSLGVFINLVIAEYREALLHADSADLGAIVTRAFTFYDVGQTSLWSWLLLIFGMLIFLVAMHEGAGGDSKLLDPYVDYHHYARPQRRTRADYETAKAAYAEAISVAADEAISALRARAAHEAEVVREARGIAAEAIQRAAEVSDSMTEWSDMGEALLTVYRNENEIVRTAPTPAYWTTFPDLRAVKRGVPDGNDLAVSANAIAAVQQANAKALALAERDIAKLLKERLAKFAAIIARIDTQAATGSRGRGSHRTGPARAKQEEAR